MKAEMKGSIFIGTDEHLADALSHREPLARCMGRAIAAGIAPQPNVMRDWVRAELNRGTTIDLVLNAMMSLYMSSVAGVTGICVPKGAHDEIKQAFRLMIEVGFDEVAQDSMEAIKAARAAR